MQSRGICLDRSPGGMRGRFANHILGNLGKFKTTVAQLIEEDEKAKAATVEATGRTVPWQQYTISDDKAILSYIINNQEYSKVGGNQLWEKMEEEKVVKGRSWLSMQARFQKRIMKNICSYDLTPQQISLFTEKEPEEGGFTQEENQAILSYIIDNRAYSQIGGKRLWTKMVRQKVVQDRTWESMRTQFQTYIMENIQSYDLTDDQLTFFKAKKGKNRQNQKYTRTEDTAILSYVISNQEYSRVTGEQLWKDMEKQEVVEGRNWRSMKSRFQNQIMENIGFYPLTEDQRTLLKEKIIVLDEEGNMEAGQRKDYQKYTTAEERTILNYIVSNQMYARVGSRQLWKKMEEDKVIEGRSWKSMQGRFYNHILKNLDCYGLTDEQISFFKEKKEVTAGLSRTNQNYSRLEDEAILTYITQTQEYSKVGGKIMWKVMKGQKTLEGRSWQSMRDRFHQTIIKNIESYDLLSEDQRASFKANKKVNDDEVEDAAAEQKKGKYTREEDKAILAYIVNNDEFSKVGGRLLWRKMKEQNVVEGRSVESMRVHFKNFIIRNIGSYELTQQQMSLFRKRVRDDDNVGEVEVISQKKWKYTKTEDEAILSYITNNQKYSNVGSEKLWKEMENQEVVEDRGWRSMMSRFRKIMEKVESYNLTKEQISSLKTKSVVKDKEAEMMDVGENNDEEDNLAIRMDDTGIEDDEEMEDDVGEVYTEDEEEVDDPEEEEESDGMSEEEEEKEEEMEGGTDLDGEEEMEEENFSKDTEEDMEEEHSDDEDGDDDEEDDSYMAYILVDF